MEKKQLFLVHSFLFVCHYCYLLKNLRNKRFFYKLENHLSLSVIGL